MSVPDEEATGKLVEAAAAIAHRRLSGQAADDAVHFLGQYYRGVGADDLAGTNPGDLYGAALAHLQLGRERERGTARVRVHNPRVDESGWQSSHTVVEIVNDDMPFLVDSVRMELSRHGLGMHLLVHPVVRVRRDESGRLLEVIGAGGDADDAVAESYIHVEVDRQQAPDVLADLERDLRQVLGDVRAAVEDWPAMRARLGDLASSIAADAPPTVAADDLAEAAAFLRWLADDHFTFLGAREYELDEIDGADVLRAVAGTGLGILRAPSGARGSGDGDTFAKLPPEVRRLARVPEPLILTKANSVATVHRPAPLDYVGVKRFDASGTPVGERRFLGLYTSAVYNCRPQEIPVVRRRIAAVVERTGLPPSSHDGKELVAIIETLPRDELFQQDERELYDTATAILRLQERQRVRLLVRRDRYGRFYSCLVFVPRDRYNTFTRVAIQRILVEALHGTGVDFQARISESVLARLHFIVRTDASDQPDYDLADLERRVTAATRTWTDRLTEALVDELGEDRGIALAHRYTDACPAGYQADVPPRVAVADIRRVEALERPDGLALHLYRPLEAAEGTLRFKVYRSGSPLSVSEVLPVLEHMGAHVVDEHPYEICPEGSAPVWIYDFGLVCPLDGELEAGLRGRFEESFAAVWRGLAEDDGFNRLVVRAGLTWREVTVLRAYAKYLRQAGTTFSQSYMEDTLAANPEVVSLIVRLFQQRFDPSCQDAAPATSRSAGEAEGRVAPEDDAAREAPATSRSAGEAEGRVAPEDIVLAALDQVVSLDQDRILRAFLGTVQATLRTNVFQDGDGRPIVMKLDPLKVPDLPLPRPMFEVWVYSPRTEGVHLRGGKVARGGIRWSDRREDFRTEVLGLMKAQMVKNAVIVPVGAKGGFVMKQPPLSGEREAVADEVVACYRTFIGGLLDVTDNLVRGEVAPPEGMVRYDGDDPYLVVAADKGTATFSDIANGISLEHGLWLGDAFASGGSSGYDHKGMGITARGAWESVKRHFRELGVDVQTTPFTVAGIGDMSGDVFGNGMRLSRFIKLVAAFDHRHIFLDPEPDPEVSFVERDRLFSLPRSSWADYDTSLLSAGGGVHPRTAKSITITPQVRAALGIEDERETMTPNELISAILRAPVDLLWNGGIGTYVKASTESHADVGDKTTDAVRVNGRDLRCRVVGEGGNLGLTQRGRVEYALQGGRINTDAIDNSAGVDCSDHEVNIKILLDAVVADGDLTLKQRNMLLAEMTDEVARLVLRHNELQTRALSLAVAQHFSLVDVHARYIRFLTQRGRLDRELEALPSDEDLTDRKAAGRGLTSPEFAVLLAYTKNTLYDELLGSGVPDDPYLAEALARYFPAPLRERYGDRIREHRLRREIVANRVANDVVDQQGTTFVFRLAEETRAEWPAIARAYTVARDVFDVRSLQAAVHASLEQLPVDVEATLLLETRKLVERGTRWVLRTRPPTADIAAEVQRFGAAVHAVAERLPDLLFGDERQRFEEAAAALRQRGAPAELAARVAAFGALYSALDLAVVADEAGEDVASVAEVYFGLGDRLELVWLLEQVNDLPRDNRWQTLARASLRDDLYAQHRALTARVLGATDADRPANVRLDAWVEANREPVSRFRQVLADVRASGVFDLATLSVAVREVAACAAAEPQ